MRAASECTSPPPSCGGFHGAETVQANLKKWLTETSELGCGDDITVVMAYFEGEQ